MLTGMENRCLSLPDAGFSSSVPGAGALQAGGGAMDGPRTRKQFRPLACLNCKNHHARCDDFRPCARCVTHGKVDTCADEVRAPHEPEIFLEACPSNKEIGWLRPGCACDAPVSYAAPATVRVFLSWSRCR